MTDDGPVISSLRGVRLLVIVLRTVISLFIFWILVPRSDSFTWGWTRCFWGFVFRGGDVIFVCWKGLMTSFPYEGKKRDDI